MYSPKLNFYFKETRPSSLTVTSHTHTCYELVYFENVNGTLKIENTSFPLKPGSLYFVYPGTSHSEIHSSDYSVIFLGFDCDKFPKHKLEETVYNVLDNKLIHSLLLRIIDEATNQKENYKQIVSLILSEIFLLLERYSADSTQSVKSITYAHNYIYEYFNQSIDFPELASSTGYSYDRFRHLFAEKYKISPKQLQMTIRLEKAVELLSEKNANCTKISELCGFSTSAQFSKLFKEKYGITPKQFCNRHKPTEQ